MSHIEQPGHSSSGAATSGGAISAHGQLKKKRHHNGASAAIAARRAGQMGPGLATAEGDGNGMPFISSSRDASEEDNDEASGFSDSASSMRLNSSASHHNRLSSTGLPTSARDRALVDSKEAIRRPSASAAADKTPSSSSPPRYFTMGQVGQEINYSNRRPSHSGPKDPLVSATLAKASQVLSTSSSNDMDLAGGRAAGGMSRTESMSSAGSDVGDGPAQVFGSNLKMGNNKLDLASLPAPIPLQGGAGSQTAMPTPRAPDAQQREHVLGQPRRKTSNPNHSVPSTTAVSAIAAARKGSMETDGEDATDGAAASPYDGDVEFAARTPATQPAGISPALHHSGSTAAPPSSSLTSTATMQERLSMVPSDVPSHSYLSHVKATTATMPGGGDILADKDDSRQGKEEEEGERVTMASPASIRSFIHKAIYEPDPKRTYRINHPVDGGKNSDRPIRIYADGVYDLFHYAHALQLRQAKLFFPYVHLIVGVVSSKSCALHKNAPVLSSSERYTSVRNCKWVDEVVEDAPWIITQELLDKYRIDYVAHDEEPYGGTDGSADIYGFCKDQGRFLPTLRTKGVSTSELLARIVEQYRQNSYDRKLAKIGHEELAFHGNEDGNA